MAHTRMDIRLRPWSQGDFWLLERTNAAEMTEHLGGPESPEQLARRHERYVRLDGDGGRMYVVESAQEGRAVGTIGFWGRTWRDQEVYETGWGVLPEFQGLGLASAAARAVMDEARRHGGRRQLHAFPSVDHPASNGVCRKAGFVLLGPCTFEYPPGHPLQSNDWMVDLGAAAG